MSLLSKIGSFFKQTGFEKGDERTVLIGAYSTRINHIYLTVFLLIWTVYEFISTGRLGVPALAFFSSQFVYWFAYIYYRKKYGG
ncbi:MAG: hypothetical protein WBK42_02230 [Dethiobacteria bacterium]